MDSRELIPNGAPLDRVAGLAAPHRDLLASLWITTAQELVAIHASRDEARRLLGTALQIGPQDLAAIVAAAGSVIPATRDLESDRLVGEAQAAGFGLGALLTEPPSATEAKDRLPPFAAGRAQRTLPASHSLLDQLPPLRSQGPRNTCVAHAALAVREQLEMAAGAPGQINLSEQYVYWWCKANDGLPAVAGTYLSMGMHCLETVGAPPEEMWRYNRVRTADEGQGPPPAEVVSGDKSFLSSRTLPLDRSDIDGIKTCLYEGRSVAFSVPVYNSWYKSPASLTWGKITMPLPGEPYDGGHAMTLVGYQDDETAPGGGYFLVRNSWQPWAWQGVWRSGYGYIPYAYIAQHASAVLSAERIGAGQPYLRGAAPGALIMTSRDIWLDRVAANGMPDQPPGTPARSGIHAILVNPGPGHIYRTHVAFFCRPAGLGIAGRWEPAGELEATWLRPGENRVGPLPWAPPCDGRFVLGLRIGQAALAPPAARDGRE